MRSRAVNHERISWQRIPRAVFFDHRLLYNGRFTGWAVRHCGHQTALWPYYVEPPPGQGCDLQTYRHLDDGKAAAIEQARASGALGR